MRVFYPEVEGGTEMTSVEIPDNFSNEDIADLIATEYALQRWEKEIGYCKLPTAAS